MGKIWIIIQREYITRVRKRSFLITTLLAPIGFFLLIASSVLITNYGQGRTDVAIIDESGLFKNVAIPDADDQTVYFHKVDEPFDQLAQQLPKEKVKKFNAIIVIPPNFNLNNPNNPGIAYRYIERPGQLKKQFINDRLNSVISKLRMEQMHISDDQVEQMQTKLKIDFSSLDDKMEKQGYTDVASIVGFVMGFAIYFSLLFYGTMIMRGVMEEKTNRVVEVLTSSVKPFQLLMGKIVGVGAVGLTQFILWIILTYTVTMLTPFIFGHTLNEHATAMNSMPGNAVDADDIQGMWRNFLTLPFLQIILLFPIYFVGGFLLYGSLFAAVGAAMGEDGDQQSLMIPITVPILISFFIAINVINNPDTPLGFWGSVIPFTSPVVMCALLPLRPVWWQVAISIFLLIGGFVLTTWIAARIYRTGILMYGKKVRLKEVARWIFARE